MYIGSDLLKESLFKQYLNKLNSMSHSTRPRLDSSLFHHLSSIEKGEHVYHFFQPKNDPIFLQSMDGTMLASIHITYQKQEGRGTIFQRPDQPEYKDFQALLNI